MPKRVGSNNVISHEKNTVVTNYHLYGILY